MAIGFIAIGMLGACSPDGLVGNAPLPSNLTDPAITRTRAGALAAYQGTLVAFRMAFDGYVQASGLLTDELQDGAGIGFNGYMGLNGETYVDSRSLLEYDEPGSEPASSYVTTYSALNRTRGQAQEALGLLGQYAPDASPALRGHAYALEGYSELLLADLFCSGIPLSTLDYDGDYTLRAGSSTAEVYQHARMLFDSALMLASDSARIRDLARVGQARALLGLDSLAAAAQAVAGVPDDYAYTLHYSATAVNSAKSSFAAGVWKGTVADQEGINGLPYRTSGDPRTTAIATGTNSWGITLYRPAKYAASGDLGIVLASGIEARLIQAEAALQGGSGDWLATLNALRTDGTFTTQPDSLDPAHIDTVWHAGSGGVAGLAPLTDPGASDLRVDLLFRERAFWLFLTGHRQGDMRRLIRDYGRPAESVYPTGPYPGGDGVYGTDVTAPIPVTERVSNPKFTGCQRRDA
jgi:hypothetical protein